MTTQQDHAEPDSAVSRAVWLALASPMLAGLVWAILMFFWWRNEVAQPDSDLATFIAGWGLVMLGSAGFIGLSVPLVIGLSARSPGTRIAAAAVGPQ